MQLTAHLILQFRLLVEHLMNSSEVVMKVAFVQVLYLFLLCYMT